MARKRKGVVGNDHLYSLPACEIRQPMQIANVDRLHSNGRTVVRDRMAYYPTLPDPKRSRLRTASSLEESMIFNADDFSDPSFLSADAQREEVEPTVTQIEKPKRGARVYVTLEHDSVLLEWAEKDVGKFLSELLRGEGLQGMSDTHCPLCPVGTANKPMYLCHECCQLPLVCRLCCIRVHQYVPFHRVKMWNGRFFDDITLKDIGVVIQLGHRGKAPCQAPAAAWRSCAVIHVNGFHPVNLQYCECDQQTGAGDRTQQLLRARLFGATIKDTATICTFEVLEKFHLLTLQSKVTAYDYYLTLHKLTDNAGLGPNYDRLKSFLRAVRKWRHLKRLKRCGRGNRPSGWENIPRGALAVRCPACPRPGFNLPENWEDAPPSTRFIYTLFVAIDANFCLKRRLVSNDTRDPSLAPGAGYFVPDQEYKEFLLKYVDQDDMSTCTGFSALLNANTKWSAGYATTGVGMAICARHGFVFTNGVEDLQKGERYCNMDFIVAAALHQFGTLPLLLLSYDIMCQWWKNLLKRWHDERFPPRLQLDIPVTTKKAIPKYHFHAHNEKDHNQYSLNTISGVDVTDCEEPERGWFRTDGTAASTREMGPGSRHDTLEDHFGFSNWQKMVGIGRLIQKKLKVALADYIKYKRRYNKLVRGIPAEKRERWLEERQAFEDNPTAPDPYYVAPSGVSETEIRRQLAEEDDGDAAKGISTLHNVMPSGMLVEMLEIEETQRRFCLKYEKDPPTTDLQINEQVLERTKLRRRLASLREVQAIYMPCAPQLLALYLLNADNGVTGTAPVTMSSTSRTTRKRAAAVREQDSAPEHQPLFFPRELSNDDLDLCVPGLATIERRLREGQMHSAIESLHLQLHIKTGLQKFKETNIRHQHPNTRARNRAHANERKIIQFAEKYRAARRAKIALSGPGPWEKLWPVLRREDVRPLTRDDPTEGEDDSEEEDEDDISWIWLSLAGNGKGTSRAMADMTDALKGHFLRAYGRFERRKEEICLLREEQRRVLVSLEKEAQDWDALEVSADDLQFCKLSHEGAAAYAARQAATRRAMSQRFQHIWKSGTDAIVDEHIEEGGDLMFTIVVEDSDHEDDEGEGWGESDNDDEDEK